MDPLQLLMRFAGCAMAGTHPESHRDRAVVMQIHRDSKRSATRGEAKRELAVLGSACTEGEISREIETPRLFCPLAPGSAAWQSPSWVMQGCKLSCEPFLFPLVDVNWL